MFRLGLIIVFLFALGFAQQLGQPAPEVTLVDAEGEVIRLSDFLGTPVVLNAWASWCAPCVEELPLFQRISDEVNGGTEIPALQFFLINNNEEPESALAFLRNDLGIDLLTGVDATREQRNAFKEQAVELDKTLDVIKNYRIRGMPSTFFIDADGLVQGVKIGFITPAETRALLASIGIDWNPLEAASHTEGSDDAED